MKFKVGDEVRILGKSVFASLEETAFNVGDIAKIDSRYHGNYNIFDRTGMIFAFAEKDLELVEKENTMKKYKVLRKINMTEFINAHQKDYGWERFYDSCKEFQADITVWQELSSFVWPISVGIETNFESIKEKYSDEFWRHLVKYGFIEEIEEKIKYYWAIEHPNKPIGERNNLIVVDSEGDRVICGYVLKLKENGRFYREPLLNSEVGVAVDSDGKIIEVDSNGKIIRQRSKYEC